ncbi:MAG TPA: S8 family serine peptidase [Vicinamibacterales bacterium]|jgi:serine protease|nr:S8 family serine peptidase [Vicinamibacterales bacterium]
MFRSKTAGVLTIVALALGVVAAQDAAPGFRTFISDLTPPGIDTGLRDKDAPRPPRPYPTDVSSRDGLPYLRGSIAVKFRPGTAPAAQRIMIDRVGAFAMDAPSYADFNIVTIDPDADPEAAAATLAEQPDVEYAQARYRMHPMFKPNDPLYTEQWNFPAIDMERAWDLNPGATPSIVVAVIDSGVAYRNLVLRRNIPSWRGSAGGAFFTFPALGVVDIPFAAAPDLGPPDRFVSPRDFIWNDTEPVDMDGHGTHVTGTIGQLTNNSVGVAGMAFNVRIMPVKVIDSLWDDILGSPFQGTDDVVARGVRYAVDSGAKVLNMSIGRSGPPSPLLQEALTYATQHGAFVSIAAGNDFEQGNPTEWPAAYANSIQGVVAVGAIGRDRLRAYYSTTGSYLELAAPGGNQRSGGSAGGIFQQTYDLNFVETYALGPTRYTAPRFDVFAYLPFQGTSMAAPHVSGLAALLMQQGITSPAAVEAAMEKFATDLGPAGRDDQYGFGLINPRASLRGLGLAQ